jgi:hypothetical protein
MGGGLRERLTKREGSVEPDTTGKTSLKAPFTLEEAGDLKHELNNSLDYIKDYIKKLPDMWLYYHRQPESHL